MLRYALLAVALVVANGIPAVAQEVGRYQILTVPLGIEGAMMFTKDSHPEWDLNVGWEPSNYWQSYSAAGTYHPFVNPFFAGARVRARATLPSRRRA